MQKDGSITVEAACKQMGISKSQWYVLVGEGPKNPPQTKRSETMNNFKVIYRILRYLEAALDCEEFDVETISPFRLGVTRERWEQILIMMQDSGYIKGIVVTKNLGDMKRHITEPICPEITIIGLEYLEENRFMRKAANMLKGAVDVVK